MITNLNLKLLHIPLLLPNVSNVINIVFVAYVDWFNNALDTLSPLSMIQSTVFKNELNNVFLVLIVLIHFDIECIVGWRLVDTVGLGSQSNTH